MLDHGTQLIGTGAPIAAAETGNLELLKMLLERGGSSLLEETAIWWGVTDQESIDSKGTALIGPVELERIRLQGFYYIKGQIEDSGMNLGGLA